jgi:hypothetical protein
MTRRQAYQLALSFALLSTDSRHINICRHPQAGMTQELLHDLRILHIRVEERSERVPEGVIRDVLRHTGSRHGGLP